MLEKNILKAPLKYSYTDGDTTFIRPELLGRGINFWGTILLFMAEILGRLVVIVSKPRFLLAFDMGDFANISAILARDFCQKAEMQPTKIQFFKKVSLKDHTP